MPSFVCSNFITIVSINTFLVRTLSTVRWTQTRRIWQSLVTVLKALSNQTLSEEFEKDKHNWFVTPLAPQGKRTPGLFKVEFEGDKIISLCIKSYCTELFATENSPGQVKFSMKGVNRGQFKNPMSHYEHVLTTKENFRACNQGIRAKD